MKTCKPLRFVYCDPHILNTLSLESFVIRIERSDFAVSFYRTKAVWRESILQALMLNVFSWPFDNSIKDRQEISIRVNNIDFITPCFKQRFCLVFYKVNVSWVFSADIMSQIKHHFYEYNAVDRFIVQVRQDNTCRAIFSTRPTNRIVHEEYAINNIPDTA